MLNAGVDLCVLCSRCSFFSVYVYDVRETNGRADESKVVYLLFIRLGLFL